VKRPRWDNCIVNHDGDVEKFIGDYFKSSDRRCLYVGGAGFDPRCLTFPKLLTAALGDRLRCVLLRETRPDPDAEPTARANKNITDLSAIAAKVNVLEVEVLAGQDNAVIGGRRATEAMMEVGLDEYTDVVLDLSALSVGISFPVARYLLEIACQFTPHKNVHLVVVSNAGVDDAIKSVPSEFMDPVHGFSGELDLEESTEQPKIWMPALSSGKQAALGIIWGKLRDPVVVCPILPLSQRDPRAGDKLLLEFENELYEVWEVEANNMVYTIEDDPMDLYRTITAVYQRFSQVFEDIEPSHVVITPSGSKTLAIGALLAAVEHNLPVRYVEAVGYTVNWDQVDQVAASPGRLIHLWFAGDACADDAQASCDAAAV
jgi:hypothetical protein